MPRRNNTKPHDYFTPPVQKPGKRRYATRQQAEAAAAEQMKYNLNLQLQVYQSPHDSGWYLTSASASQPR